MGLELHKNQKNSHSILTTDVMDAAHCALPGEYLKDVYLSISKLCTTESIKQTLLYLSHFEINLYTFDGSSYDEHHLNNMDAILVLPPSFNNTPDRNGFDAFPIGKGQWNEIDYMDHLDSYLISDISRGLRIDDIKYVSRIPYNGNWNKWGTVSTNGMNIDISYYTFNPTAGYHALIENGVSSVLPESTFHLALTRTFI